MEQWLQQYWWLLATYAAIAVWVGWLYWRIRRRGGTESLAIRVWYAMAPAFDPRSEIRRKLGAGAIRLWFIFIIGVLFFMGVLHAVREH
jgi:hypothetical protein